MSDKTYVTTSIPYVNAPPHIGHALEMVQADVIARYNRLIGNETFFQTGTDENAFKNVLAAQERGIGTQELVDQNSEAFRNVCRALCVSHDNFIRTTEERHRLGVFEFWNRLKPGDVYRAKYRGLYCPGCEDFYLERDLVNGLCPDHGAPPNVVEEENYFFRLSAHQEEIEDLLEHNRIKVVPAKRKNEVLAFVRSGLKDFSISREATRSGGWGIPVPGDPSQIIYVWVDALINYISGLGLGSGKDWRGFWNEDGRKIHVIGKNVWKFHAVYWPAMLLSAGLSLPDEIVVHGFLTVQGQKISKSLGNVIDPLEYVDAFGADAVRLYLLSAVPPFDDGDFSADRLKQLYNQDLANGLGNLVSRLTTLCERGQYGGFKGASSPEAPQGYHEAMQAYEFGAAVGCLWDVISGLDRDIERVKPWQSLKADDLQVLNAHLLRWLRDLHKAVYWLGPLLPNASRRVLDILSQEPIRSCTPMFPRAQ